MFGFIIGTLSLIGLLKLARHGRYGYGGRRGGPRRWMLRRLFERLDTTPGQEKVLSEVADEVEAKVHAVRDQFVNARSTFARSMRQEHFDGASVGEAFDTQQAAIDDVKKTLREGMAKIHEALTPEQRREFADLLEFGPRMNHGCHGRFSHHHGHWRHAAGPVSL